MIALLLAALALALLMLYVYNNRAFNYWKAKGVKHDEPVFLFGNNLERYLQQKSFTQLAVEAYLKYPKEKVVGFYRYWRPELVVRDPEVVKRILITDFHHFYLRGLNRCRTYVEPLMRNLFLADGDLWKQLRQRLTPAFTSGKLKAMFPLIVERAERLQARALQAASGGQTLDARELMSRYTTEIIGSCGFGLDDDTLNDENSAFRKLGTNIFKLTFLQKVIIKLKELFPKTLSRVKSLKHVEREITNIVNVILKKRYHRPSGRNDFIDLLLEAQFRGRIFAESMEKMKADGTPELVAIEMDDLLIMAQTFMFFAAGFETSSSATSFTLHQLAYNPHVQEKVQKEVDTVLAKHGNKLSYDGLKEMTYLEWTFKEGLRMFPSKGFLIRRCVRQCTVPGLGLTIDPGVTVVIPIQALHNDPQYFASPDEFRPERFDPDKLEESNEYVYLPFGEGRRACIGAELGLMQSLAGLAAVLARFSVRPAKETLKQPSIDPTRNIVQSVQGGLPLLFLKRNLCQ